MKLRTFYDPLHPPRICLLRPGESSSALILLPPSVIFLAVLGSCLSLSHKDRSQCHFDSTETRNQRNGTVKEATRDFGM